MRFTVELESGDDGLRFRRVEQKESEMRITEEEREVMESTPSMTITVTDEEYELLLTRLTMETGRDEPRDYWCRELAEKIKKTSTESTIEEIRGVIGRMR